MATLQTKRFDTPDETRTPPKTKVEVITFDDRSVMRFTFEPGWKWSEHVKPTAGTASCQVAHFVYLLSGREKTVMDDGTEVELGPGDVALIPPGHDGWVLGDEPCVLLDFGGGQSYAKPAS
jgi:quercetin dioxygenase-like cupin family protein